VHLLAARDRVSQTLIGNRCTRRGRVCRRVLSQAPLSRAVAVTETESVTDSAVWLHGITIEDDASRRKRRCGALRRETQLGSTRHHHSR
jgi:hypothetical protein